MFKALSFLLFVSFVMCQGKEPNPPTWPCNVFVFDPSTPQQTQKIIDDVFTINGGHEPAWHGQFSPYRFAFLFKPGTHEVEVNVGYYTSVFGLGQSPSQTFIKDVACQNGDFDYTGGALNNFWRSAENFETTPTIDWNNSGSPTMLWAVSQASPLRNVKVNGDLTLFQYNSGCCAGYASGGFLSNSVISGNISSGSQQQFFTRNTDMGGWEGGNWNMVFLGNSGNLPSPHCSNNGGPPITSIEKTPILAEKPYLVMNDDGKSYSIAVPNLQTNKVGPTSDFTDATMIDLSDVYVAKDTDSADIINSKLESGLHLILTAGVYNLTDSIVVSRPNTVVLGLGFPTLIAADGKEAIVVTASEGARLSGVLLQAGPITSPSLLQWGSNDAGNPENPGFIYDIFVRVGGTNDPEVQQVSADTMVTISQGYVVVDNAWLWRADHGIYGLVYNGDNPNQHGMVVDADSVTTYGLASEHQLQDLVQWNGDNGRVYFYQSELPYDVTEQEFGTPGYAGININPSVSSFEGYGMGVYSYFRDYDVTTTNGILAGPSATIVNPLTVFLNGKGQITHVINGEGEAVNSPGSVSYVCN